MQVKDIKSLWFKIEKVGFLTGFVLQIRCGWFDYVLMNSFWSKVSLHLGYLNCQRINLGLSPTLLKCMNLPGLMKFVNLFERMFA